MTVTRIWGDQLKIYVEQCSEQDSKKQGKRGWKQTSLHCTERNGINLLRCVSIDVDYQCDIDCTSDQTRIYCSEMNF